LCSEKIGAEHLMEVKLFIIIFELKQKFILNLKNWRRVNVAFTRPKSKLLILGSLSYLKNIPSIKDFVNFIE
jgi:superfamily I DNA and/or RNA helicase